MSWRWAALKAGIQEVMAYRLEFFLGVFGYALVPFAVQMVLWYSLFEIDGRSHVSGLTYSDLVQYSAVTLIYSQVRGGDIDFDIAELIRTGDLSQFLLRPVSVVQYLYLHVMGGRLVNVMIGLSAGMIASLWTSLTPERLIGGMVLALAGNVIHYLISATIATVAFYWEEIWGVLRMKNMAVALLSGELIPLMLFPDSARWLWESTPFYLYVFGPVQYARGAWSHAELLQHLGISMIWIAVSYFILRAAWFLGIRKYQSLGG